MNNQNFYLRLIALLMIIMAVFFYNGTVKDKEQAQDIADPVSYTHLRILKQNKLVKSRREGKSIFYSLADDHVRTIINQGREHIEED